MSNFDNGLHNLITLILKNYKIIIAIKVTMLHIYIYTHMYVYLLRQIFMVSGICSENGKRLLKVDLGKTKVMVSGDIAKDGLSRTKLDPY